jgi:hypothetical protein
MGMKEQPFDPRDHEAFVREIDPKVYDAAAANLPRGVIPVRRGRSFSQHLSSNNVIAVSTIPFLIMPGDGAANGCQFTGTAGAFTLSAAIVANVYTTMAGCYAYFSAGFGGSSLPAGWYWTEFSSDTAGIVYANTYTSGTPRRPVTKTPISTNLTGWVTATTNEITGPNDFLLPGGALGKNGTLQIFFRCAGSGTGNKTLRARFNDVGTTLIANVGSAATTGVFDALSYAMCCDSHTVKNIGRNSTSVIVGVGVTSNSMATNNVVSIDTSVDTLIDLSLVGSSNMSATILQCAFITATYGD